ncbi:citramalyl-CoA lyase, mitochondrial isoform X3 [Procambarus clarkii]|uniref:citramalyl-CoA lyase, mitochondrial isoform X3 n=1 Tax=Procambarus clarkii TaxID=6728 RepID=UPI001E671F50|nr:citramalyl-CoA lyase, mitochondrial-like isoform X2 [Procambarus clarkii]
MFLQRMLTILRNNKHMRLRRAADVVNLSTTSNSLAQESKRYIPRRAVLYVPGNDDRKLNKIPSLRADCIVMDCEDGVALSKKESARSKIHHVLHSKEIDFTGKDCSVRFNSVESGLCEADMQEILSAKYLPSTIHLPKVDSPAHLEWFTDKLKFVMKGHNSSEKLRLIIFTESAESLLSLPEICRRGVELSRDAPFDLDGIVFGSDDFCADIGATRTNEAGELTFARQYVVTVAKAFKLQAVDLVYIDYKDLDGLRTQSEEGAGMGFTGKQVIHPDQVPVVQEAFSPRPEKVEWAASLVRAFEQHQQEGKGAFTFRGHMIDMPLLLQARNVLQLASNT